MTGSQAPCVTICALGWPGAWIGEGATGTMNICTEGRPARQVPLPLLSFSGTKYRQVSHISVIAESTDR
jgi:hypothetical protein